MESERPARSTSLDNLPNELILLILGNFCLHCREGPQETPQAFFEATGQQYDEPSWYALDVSALHSMSLVCTRFLPLAQEILYHEFIPGYGDSWCSAGYDWFWRLVPFLRTVALNPDRAALVKRVHVNLNLLNGVTEVEAQVDAVLEDATQARGIDLSDFVGPFRELLPTFRRDQYRPSADEVVGMLLTCLPHLKTLSFSAGTPLSGVPASALRAVGVSALTIETLDITGCNGNSRGRWDGILELAAPTIRSLFIDVCDSDGLSSLTRFLPNLRNLCITNSTFSGSELASFLSRCVSLETFSYRSISMDDNFLLSDAVAHLIRNKGTLRTLRLDIAGNRRSQTELTASLNGFPVLRHLVLSSKFLYHSAGGSVEDANVFTRLLPPSLISLQLGVVDDMGAGVLPRLASGLLHLAQAASRGQFPNLKSVSCDREQLLDGYGLHVLFAGAGVDFGYGGWPFKNDMPGPARSITPMDSDDEYI